MVVFFGEKTRFNLEHTVEAKGIAAEYLVEADAAAFGAVDAGIRIDTTNTRLHRGEILPRHQIGLVEQHDIGETKLLLRLRGTIELAEKMLGIHHRDDGIELGLAADVFIHKKGMCDWRGIGKPGRFNDDAVHAAPAPHQAAKNSYEIAPHRAADAAVVHFENFFFGIDDEIIVDADLAELIDDHRIALAVRLREDSVEQRGLSGTEIASDDRDR